MTLAMAVCVGGPKDGTLVRSSLRTLHFPIPVDDIKIDHFDPLSDVARVAYKTAVYKRETIYFPEEGELVFYIHEGLTPMAALSWMFDRYSMLMEDAGWTK